MKAAIAFILCVILIEIGTSVRAEDTPNQAAARAALEHKLYQLNHSLTLRLPNTNTAAATADTAGSATKKAGVVKAGANAAALQPQSASVSPPPSDTAFTPEAPADNASAQAAALAALNKKMSELNHSKAKTRSNTNSTATMATVPSAVPQHEVSTDATLVTEMPAAEIPAARVPTAASGVVVPASAAPAAVTPAPKVSTATAVAAAVAVVPTAAPGPAAKPTRRQRVLSFPFSAPGLARPANKLVTTTGAIYNNVEVERVLEDGIVISYVPAHGGWARTKVPFEDLPREIRRQYENH